MINSDNPELKRYKLLKGVYSRVARRLGVDRTYVSRVAHGERTSERVSRALAAELRRIEKKVGSARPASVPPATVVSPVPAKSSVLVVDDEPNVANTVAQILQEHGFETRVAYGGPEAIREVAACRPDIVISDVVMPQINGIEAAKAIHELCPQARIVLFSGQTITSDLLQTARSQGYVFELLAKPIEIDALLSTLERPSTFPQSLAS